MVERIKPIKTVNRMIRTFVASIHVCKPHEDGSKHFLAAPNLYENVVMVTGSCIVKLETGFVFLNGVTFQYYFRYIEAV